MAQTLSSPGVSVSVENQSFYTSAAPGTIPLIFVATAANKLSNSGTGIAPGTLKKNDGKVYLLSSQKELLDTFGTPIFKTDASNNPIHAGEQNEYGLQAAYSYLAVSNRAYVVRADVDLEQLSRQVDIPSGPPENGTFWFDTASTHWGIFQWNSDSATTPLGQTFSNIVPAVYTDPKQVVDFLGSDYKPKSSLGVSGGYAIVAVTSLATLWYKSPRTQDWVVAGSADWVASIPTISGTNAESSFTLNDTATLTEDADAVTINGELFDSLTSLTDLVTKINSNDIIEGIFAVIANGKLVIYSNDAEIDLAGTLPQTALKLGISVGIYKVPALQLSAHTDVPLFKRKDWSATVNGCPSGSLWIKTTSNNRGADWFVQRYATASQSWITVKAPMYPNGHTAIAALDPNGGGTQLAGNSLYVKYNDAELSNPIANFKIYRRKDVTATTIKSTLITPLTFSSGRYSFVIDESIKGSSDLQSREINFDIPAFQSGLTDQEKVDAVIEIMLQNINSVSPNVVTSVSAYRENNTIIISHILSGDIIITDGTGNPIPKLFSTVTTENFYHHSSYANGDPANANKYIATMWTEYANDKLSAFATPSDKVLTGGPVDGLLWFNPNLEEVDIMVKDENTWRAYRNVDHGSGVGATDPKGPIVSPSKPKTQHDGQELVEGDLWIDSSDTENYPALYKYINFDKKWVKVDITDQITEDGIVFADARWNTSGLTSEPSTIVELLGGRLGTELSAEQRAAADFVDFDAPNPALYPKGMLLWNLRRSGNNVKKLHKNYVDVTSRNIRYNNDSMAAYYPHRWVSEAANLTSGAGAFGRHAQRGVVVQALQAVVNKNQQIRETDFRVFNLIACPGYPELVGEMKILNYDRGITAFVLGDTPARLPSDTTSLLNWGSNTANAAEDGDLGLITSDEYLAFFYPWGYTSDNLGNNIVVPPTHMMLRTIALSDNTSHPWFAPAGTTRGKINNADTVGYVNSSGEYVPVALNNGQRDTLASIKVNPITIVGTSPVNFGQYTRALSASALDRINVARLVVQLRRQFTELSKPYLFEPNDQATRAQIKHAAESLLLELAGQRAIYDYAVVCDATNNTPDTIDRNELHLDVAIEPTKSIEFIYIPLILKNTGEIKGLKGV